MTALRALIPRGLVHPYRIWQATRRFPSATVVTPYVSPDAVIGRRCVIGVDVTIGPKVSVGESTCINRGAIVESGSIGKFCSIAPFVQIGQRQHPVRHLSTSSFIYGESSITGSSSGFVEIAEPPTIGCDVWVGSSAVIMQGVTIGHGAIVGAGAVVTRDVAPYAIVAGVPARQIGVRFEQSTVDDLLEWRWWDLSDRDIAALGPLAAAGEQWHHADRWHRVSQRSHRSAGPNDQAIPRKQDRR